MKIAIVGSGVAALGSAYFLKDYPENFEFTIFDRASHVGGHSNTASITEAGAEGTRTVYADTGFMVFNRVTYPHLCRLFAELDVRTQETSMSFAVRHGETGLEYQGSSINGLFAQRRNLFNLRYLRMLRQIGRFNADAVRALADPRYEEYSLGRFLDEGAYGEDFRNLYLVPISASVWSTPPDLMLDFPALTLIRFFHNHGFLGMYTQHPWYTLEGGARQYVEKITAAFRDRIRLGHAVESVRREGGKVTVSGRRASGEGFSEAFDQVILGAHADETLAMLKDPSPRERRLLSEFKYQPNPTLLHTDDSVMPKRKRAWASWVYRMERGEPPAINYWMNSLQGVSDRQNYFVTLNDSGRVDPAKVIERIDYTHPLLNLGAIRAQRELPLLNSEDAPQTKTYFCGSYFRYGFHEDAFGSAVDLMRVYLPQHGRNFRWA